MAGPAAVRLRRTGQQEAERESAATEPPLPGETSETPAATDWPGPDAPKQQLAGTAKKAEPEEAQEIKNWRGRMATDEAKQIYRDRAATAESASGGLIKGRYGLRRFVVRGVSKVTSVVLLVVLTHNIMRLRRTP